MWQLWCTCWCLALALGMPLAVTVADAARSNLRGRGRGKRKCGSKPRPAEDLGAVLEHEARWRQRPGARYATPQTLNIVFNVITTSAGLGNLPDAVLLKQIDILNSAYGGQDTNNGFSGHVDTNIRFRLAGINRYVNNARATQCGDEGSIDSSISTTYRVPGNVINIYTCDLVDNLLGYAYFPCGSNSWQMWLKYSTMAPVPGQPYTGQAPYNGGDTMVHELGHNLGLEHTFQGGCANPGDSISDTPAEQSSFGGACPPGSAALTRDTCPSQPGFDPVQNFMDYSDDACMDRFSAGQADRMQSELDRCAPNLKNAPRRCVASGSVGTAPQYSVCFTATCRTDTMPNGQAPPASGWCYTYGGTPNTLWSSCWCMDDDQAQPTSAPVGTTPTTKAPTMKAPTTKAPSSFPTFKSPTRKPTRRPTSMPTRKPVKSPTARPTTKRPTVGGQTGAPVTPATSIPTTKKPTTKTPTTKTPTTKTPTASTPTTKTPTNTQPPPTGTPFSLTVNQQVQIPDGAFNPFTWYGARCIQVPVVGTLAALTSVTVSLSHSWIGDMVLTLETSEGWYMVLMDRPADSKLSYGENGASVVKTGLLKFVDSGAPVSARTMGSSDPVCPAGSTCSFNVWGGHDLPGGTKLSNLVGLATDGMWLCAGDGADQDTGYLWGVTIEGAYA